MRGLFLSASSVKMGAGAGCRNRGGGEGGGVAGCGGTSMSGLVMPLMSARRRADSSFLCLASSSTKSARSCRRSAKAKKDRKIASWSSRFGSL